MSHEQTEPSVTTVMVPIWHHRRDIKNCRLALKIISLLPNTDCFVYGGFVRDFIVRGEKFNDLDLLIVNKNHHDDQDSEKNYEIMEEEAILKIRNEFENNLKNNQIEIISMRMNRETVDYVVRDCSLDKDDDDVEEDSSLELNVIYERIENDVPDFDVNNLKFQNGTLSQRLPIGNCTVDSIVKNIMEKSCRLLVESSLNESETNYYIRRRVKKMQKKGWSIKNMISKQ